MFTKLRQFKDEIVFVFIVWLSLVYASCVLGGRS